MSYKLIASDMDGTLLNSRGELTERTRASVCAALDAGVMFVTATGRPYCNIRIINDILNKDMPFITFNGAAAYMGKSGEKLLEHFMDIELASEAFQLGQELGVPQIIWALSEARPEGELWVNRECAETIGYRDFSTIGHMDICNNLDVVKDAVRGILKVLWIIEPSMSAQKRTEMSRHFQNRLICCSSSSHRSHFLEFFSPQAGKGAALAAIGERFGIPATGIIAIGDADNDVSMLEYAGFSVAMGNAGADVKSKCDYVTLTNDEDGVAQVIEKYIL